LKMGGRRVGTRQPGRSWRCPRRDLLSFGSFGFDWTLYRRYRYILNHYQKED